MTKKPETKKEKQRKKNRRNWNLFLQHETLRAQVDIAAPEITPPPPPVKTQEEKNQEIWSAKLHEVRNRNTGRKEAAREKWNRFSGTSDAGSRGR